MSEEEIPHVAPSEHAVVGKEAGAQMLANACAARDAFYASLGAIDGDVLAPLALERSREIARKVTDDLGGLGLFGVELFVKDDMVWFSEVSPRPHDTGMVTMASQVQSEFELHAKAILGLPVNVALRSPGASAVIYGQLEAKGIAFEGVADALSVPGSDLRLFGKPESFARRRMGVALASADDIDTARQRAVLAASKVQPVEKK